MIIGEIGNCRRVSLSKYGPTILYKIFLTKNCILLFLEKSMQTSFTASCARKSFRAVQKEEKNIKNNYR